MKINNHSIQCRRNTLCTLFVTILLTLPGILSAQSEKTKDKNEELGPFGRTAEIINVMSVDLSIPIDQYSFFFAGKLGIYTGEPYYNQGRIMMLPSGAHSFLVTPGLVAMHEGRFIYDAPENAIRVDCVLEPGKFYTFKHDKMNSLTGIGNTKNVSVVELFDQEGKDDTQRIAANFKAFVEYYKANPGALEGTWITQNGKSKITFAGDRFSVTVRSFQKDWTMEGRFRFNEETIIASFESQTVDAENNPKTVYSEQRIWYYKKDGNSLEVDGSLPTGNVKGIYTKVAE